MSIGSRPRFATRRALKTKKGSQKLPFTRTHSIGAGLGSPPFSEVGKGSSSETSPPCPDLRSLLPLGRRRVEQLDCFLQLKIFLRRGFRSRRSLSVRILVVFAFNITLEGINAVTHLMIGKHTVV